MKLRRSQRLASACLLALLACFPAAAFDPGNSGPLPATGTVEVAFSPWDDTEALLLRTLSGAKSEIYVQAYVFTSRKLARALIEARRRGIAVEVLADREMSLRSRGSRMQQLVEEGIPVRLEFRYSAAHNKVILIDPLLPRNAVITGSYNFTYAARAKNAENMLVLRDNPRLARAYFNNYLRHRDGAVPYAAALPAD
jgi:phosphatidylserine/phosphatidylglycerophosphate/cardiolipin synthase-like enzyme